jgi:Type II CAAX prenyl endopeptidase Rce1-like
VSGSFGNYVRQSRALSVSLVLVLPLLLAYEAGILLYQSPVENHAGLLVKRVIAHFGVNALLAITALAAVVFVIALWTKYRRAEREFRLYGVMFVESAAWAALLGPVVVAVGSKFLSAGADEGADRILLRVILLMGAGAWEELVFRFALLGGIIWLGTRAFKGDVVVVTLIGVIVSSAVFALFHHLGPLGEPITADRVIFRVLAGAGLCGLYLFRGLGISVYTHAFYNVGVLLAGEIARGG